MLTWCYPSVNQVLTWARCLVGGCPWRRVSDALSSVPGGAEGPWPTLGPHKLQPCLLELCKFFSQCLCRPDQPRTPQRRYCPAVSPTSDRRADRQTGRPSDRQRGGQTDRWAVRQIDWQRGGQTNRGRQTDIVPSISPEQLLCYMFALSIIHSLFSVH